MGPHEAVVRVWDLEQSTAKFTLVGHKGSVNSVAIMPNGSCILSGGTDGTLRVWSADTGSELLRIAHKGGITCVCALPDSRLAASMASGRGRQSVKLWDTVTGSEIATLYDGDNTIGVMGPNDYLFPAGLVAATQDGGHIVFTTDSIEVWSVPDSKIVGALPQSQRHVTSLIPLPDHPRVLFTLDDGRLVVYDWKKDAILADLKAHSGVAWDAAVSADARFAVTCGSDAAVRYWDLVHYKELASFVADSLVKTCDMGRDGTAIVVGTAIGRIHFLQAKGVKTTC
jgi:hypothetical protein